MGAFGAKFGGFTACTSMLLDELGGLRLNKLSYRLLGKLLFRAAVVVSGLLLTISCTLASM